MNSPENSKKNLNMIFLSNWERERERTLFQFSWDSIKKRVYFCPFGSIILMYVYMNNWVKM